MHQGVSFPAYLRQVYVTFDLEVRYHKKLWGKIIYDIKSVLKMIKRITESTHGVQKKNTAESSPSAVW